MPTEPHRLSPAARSVAVYLDDELTRFIQDPLVRDRITDRWAQHLDEAGLLADLSPSGLPRRRRLVRFGSRGTSLTRAVLRMFSRL